MVVTILYGISFSAEFVVTATERGDRGECHIGFPSLTFQNPEEGGNKPLKRRFLNKKDSLNYLSFF